jgi:anthranilate synthase component 1
VDEIVHELQQPLASRALEFRKDAPEIHVTSNMTPERYADMIGKAKEFIRAGDIIQVVLAQRFQAKIKASALDIYRALRSVNPSPYMFLLDFGGFQLVGASPEVHVRCEEGRVEIRPIAGTRWRGKTPEEDARLETELLYAETERAAHLISDLARNVGRVADSAACVCRISW